MILEEQCNLIEDYVLPSDHRILSLARRFDVAYCCFFSKPSICFFGP